MIRKAYHRLLYKAELKTKLEQEFVGTTFHLPVFETDEEQQLRQRPDYEELLLKFYGNSEPSSPSLDSEELTYSISDISIHENRSILYKAKRALGKSEFNANVHFHLDFGEEQLKNLQLTEHPLYDNLDANIDYALNQTELTLYHNFGDWRGLSKMFFVFNIILARRWATPETTSELTEATIRWEQYNRFKRNSQ